MPFRCRLILAFDKFRCKDALQSECANDRSFLCFLAEQVGIRASEGAWGEAADYVGKQIQGCRDHAIEGNAKPKELLADLKTMSS